MSTGLFLVRRRQHLDDAADLLVAADDRVELALAGVLGEVAAVPLERLVLLLGVLARDAVAAAHLLQRVEHGVVADAQAAQEVADAAGDLRHGEEQVLGGEVVVAERRRARRRRASSSGRRRARAAPAGRSRRRPCGSCAERVVDAVADGLGATRRCARARGSTTPSGWPISAASRCSGVTWEWLLVARQRLGGAEGLAGLAGELVGVERHADTSGCGEPFPKVDNTAVKFIPAPPAGQWPSVGEHEGALEGVVRPARRSRDSGSRAARGTSNSSWTTPSKRRKAPVIAPVAQVDHPDAAGPLDPLGLQRDALEQALAHLRQADEGVAARERQAPGEARHPGRPPRCGPVRGRRGQIAPLPDSSTQSRPSCHRGECGMHRPTDDDLTRVDVEHHAAGRLVARASRSARRWCRAR